MVKLRYNDQAPVKHMWQWSNDYWIRPGDYRIAFLLERPIPDKKWLDKIGHLKKCCGLFPSVPSLNDNYNWLFSCSSFHVIGFSLIFLQDVRAQEQNDNLFPPTLPPLRTAAPTRALEAPRAHRLAAWHEIIVISTTSRATISPQSHLYRVCAFVFFSNA